jgi:hypothetical protein
MLTDDADNPLRPATLYGVDARARSGASPNAPVVPERRAEDRVVREEEPEVYARASRI